MPLNPDDDKWNGAVRDAMARYAEPLLRLVAGRLVKPRTSQPVDDLLDKAVAALTNPPVVDRRIKDLAPAARKLLALAGLSRQPRWKVGHLATLLACLGHAEGLAPLQAAFEAGLLYPEPGPGEGPIDDFISWVGSAGTMSARVFVHPAVAHRARGEDLELPAAGGAAEAPSVGAVRTADGLEWPLRLAALCQEVQAGPIRLTQSRTLFKRDQTRLSTNEVLSGPAADQLAPIRDAGALALFWAAGVGLLEDRDGELHPAVAPAFWDAGLPDVLPRLFAALPLVESWDPLLGYAPVEGGLSPFPSAALLSLLLCRRWAAPADVAQWLWEHHPSWAGTVSREAGKNRGPEWAEAFLLGVAYPLQLVEAAHADGGWLVRLSDLGRHLLGDAPEPPPRPTFPQTLLVQPNAEVLAYRQGLTPELIGRLTRFARWKGIGPACTLELNPEQTYRGLESGLTLPMILQTIARHSSRPIPPSVADLLQRWSNKRERITVYGSAVLVEFPTAADLDAAVTRGIVSVRLTDRIAMTADGKEPGLSQLRLIGNRDYESKPQKCVTVGDDGVTLTVDAAQADLLLEAEVGRYADPLDNDVPTLRKFRLSPPSLRRAAELGLSVTDIDAWFVDRTGAPLSPAGRLFLLGRQLPRPALARRLVLHFPTPEVVDGVMQWPDTRRLVADRLGPVDLAVDADRLDEFRKVLDELGVVVPEAPVG